MSGVFFTDQQWEEIVRVALELQNMGPTLLRAATLESWRLTGQRQAQRGTAADFWAFLERTVPKTSTLWTLAERWHQAHGGTDAGAGSGAKPTCGTCQFYNEHLPHALQGICRRYPPSNSDTNDMRFQLVSQQAWCGEYQPRAGG